MRKFMSNKKQIFYVASLLGGLLCSGCITQVATVPAQAAAQGTQTAGQTAGQAAQVVTLGDSSGLGNGTISRATANTSENTTVKKNPAQQSASQAASPSTAQRAGQSVQGSAAQTAEKASQSAARITGQQAAVEPEVKSKDSQESQAEPISVETDVESKTESTAKTGSKLPWQQQTAASTRTKTGDTTREQEIKRFEIDPVTGLYVETAQGIEISGVSEKMSFEVRQEDLLEWGFWELDGRIGLVVDKDSYNGSLSWEQEGDKLDFRFRGPLGFGGVRIHGVLGEEVRVKTTKGEEFFLQDVESDMQTQLGWSMPIDSLRYWSLGITDPEQDAEVVLNENDLLDELKQGPWKVVYNDYMDVDGVMLPRKFKITGPKTRISMIVNNWTIPGSE
jgi:outer membrane lipoprotein LolB